MNSDLEKIGALIQQVRQDRGLTQAEFAARLGTSQSAITRIEKGKQNLSLEILARMSEVLNKRLMAINVSSINLRIHGGRPLSGTISCKTSKNAAVSLLIASLLNQGTTRLKNVARIEEVNRIIEVLTSIGVKIRWIDRDLEIKPPAKLHLEQLNETAAKRTRSVIMLAGALMHDYASFKIPYAGGCALGKRTVLPHIYALEEFGSVIDTTEGHYQVANRIHSPRRDIVLYESGDTVTENVLMAAARCETETVIKFASANYMVQDLCFYLQKLGVKIDGIGTTTLRIRGLKQIHKNVSFAPSEDPVEAMTFISAAVTTNSQLTIQRVPADFLELELLKLEKMGLKFDCTARYPAANGRTELIDVTIHPHNGHLRAAEEKLYGRPYPGLNIDHLPYFVPIAAVAKGRTLIHDWVFEDRAVMYTEIKKLGADITLADPHRAYITGPTRWRSADISCPDGIRPAMMLLIGMLAANGTSVLRNVYTINRGYEDIVNRLNGIGARIEIINSLV